MPTNVLVILDCNPCIPKAKHIEFSKFHHELRMNEDLVSRVEFHDYLVKVEGRKSDGSEYSTVLHLLPNDRQALREFAQ